MNNSRTHKLRTAYIDRLIRAGKYPNCQHVVQEFEVDRKTVQRDIELMRELGAPLEYDAHRHGFYYSQPNYAFPSIALTESEIFAMTVNDQILKQYQSAPYYAEIKKVIDKIMQFFPTDMLVEENASIFSFVSPPASPVKRQQFEILQKAAAAEKQVQLKYYSPHSDAETERRVDPYNILNLHGTWYLIGFCHLRHEYRTFALHRIITLERTDVDFYKPGSFSVEHYLEHSFGIYLDSKIYHVKLKFSAYEARWIRERQWHKSQKLTTTEDGSLILEMDVQGLEDVKRWVLQYGAEVEVLEPGELREAIGREAEGLEKKYLKNT